MKKKYIVPDLQIEKFHVENIMEESAVINVLIPGMKDAEMGQIDFGTGNTLQSINYKSFAK